MTSSEIRNKFLEFFKDRGHAVVPSSSLIPEGDATTLFTGSGMQPLLPYLLGKPHPLGKRVADSQKSFRAEDIDEVGDNRHTTFFEMLGNWSFGDYSKKEQIPWIFEFLTGVVGIDPKKLYVTCFIGAPEYGIPKDTEAGATWKKIFEDKHIKAEEADIGSEADGYARGMKPGEHIFYYDGFKNWWNRGKTSPGTTPVGDPCGPDSEMFYDFGTPHNLAFGERCHPNCDCGRFMEIGNNVFMVYRKEAEGKFVSLTSPNIDFGGGLERIAAASNDDPDVFHIDVFRAMRTALETLGHQFTKEEQMSKMRVILDHVRASVFLIADGVRPSNKGQGYVLRRLLRRSMAHAKLLAFPESWMVVLRDAVRGAYTGVYENIESGKDEIAAVMQEEYDKFGKILGIGLKHVEKLQAITADDAFMLHQSYGFPFELTKELARERGMELRKEDFEEVFKKHQDISRAGQEKKFGGHGLILDNGEIRAGDEEELKKCTRLHTATHMLQQALRDVLGDEVRQAGSDITAERTRFDFTFGRKLTPEEIKKVEARVNEKMKEDLPVAYVELPRAEAEKSGALYFFKAKYGDIVKVYYMGKDVASAWSKEFCGGPHVHHTAEVGDFKVAKEEAVSAGVRRIRGVVAP